MAYSSKKRQTQWIDVYKAIAVDNARFEKLFAQHGGTIIAHEVFRRQKNPLPVIEHLKELTEAVLRLKGSATDELRKQYTLDICTALSSVFWKQLRWRLFLRDYSMIRPPSIQDDLPAALAATGNTKLLQDFTSPRKTYLTDTCSCLPSPFESAAACGQTEVTQMILELAINEPLHFSTQGRVRYCTMDALYFAVRKGQKQTADLIFDSRCGSPNLFVLFSQCISYQDIGLICKALTYRKTISVPDTTLESPTIGLTEAQMLALFQSGSCSILRALLRDGFIDPNHWADTTPLTLAIQNHRYDLARVLLQNGAHVDGVPKVGTPLTPLWHAAKDGYVGYGSKSFPGVRFLLQHGADPDTQEDSRSPLRVAQNLWPDVCFLLQQAKDFGKDVALHPDTWKRYEQRRLPLGLNWAHVALIARKNNGQIQKAQMIAS